MMPRMPETITLVSIDGVSFTVVWPDVLKAVAERALQSAIDGSTRISAAYTTRLDGDVGASISVERIQA